MGLSLRGELRVLRAMSLLSVLGLAVLGGTAFQQARSNMGEITVERINVVKSDDRLRMVIANGARQATSVINGKPLLPDRKRPAGVIFFNEEGDEQGGLIFGVQRGNQSASLTFDQYKQDQAVGVVYGETDGQRAGGLRVWDHTNIPIDELLTKHEAARALPEPERKMAIDALGARDNGATRAFVGKERDRSSVVVLSDAHGKARLRLRVEAEGSAKIEFLNADGRVVQTVGPRR